MKQLTLKEILSVFGAFYFQSERPIKTRSYVVYKAGVIYAKKIDGKFTPESPALFAGRIEAGILGYLSGSSPLPDGFQWFSSGSDADDSCKLWAEGDTGPDWWLMDSLDKEVKHIIFEDHEQLQHDYYESFSATRDEMIDYWIRWYCVARSLENVPFSLTVR